MRRAFIAAAAVGLFVGLVAVQTYAATPVTPQCVEVQAGDGWYSIARGIAPGWYAVASQTERDAFANYLANANGEKGTAAALYVGELVCFNPGKVPTSSTTTSSTSTTTATTQPATTTTPASTSTTTSTSTTSPPSSSTTAPSTTSTVPSGVCSGAAGTPGSSDGQGGCFPSADNTGPNAPESSMAAYTGPCTITVPTVIDSKVIRCELRPLASLTISNSYIYGSITQPDGYSVAFTVKDSFMNGNNPWACTDCGIGYRNFTVLRTEIIGTNRGAYCEQVCLVQDSYIHGSNLQPIASNLAHASAVRVEQYATLIHNTLACDFMGPFPNDEIGCSADMSGYADFAPIHDNLIQNNLFRANPIGQYYCAYGGGSPKPHTNDPPGPVNIRFIDNVFERGSNGRCGTGGPIIDFPSGRTGNVWSNNRWSDGALVPAA